MDDSAIRSGGNLAACLKILIQVIRLLNLLDRVRRLRSLSSLLGCSLEFWVSVRLDG